MKNRISLEYADAKRTFKAEKLAQKKCINTKTVSVKTFNFLLPIFYPPIYHWIQHRSQLYRIQIRSKNRNLKIGNKHLHIPSNKMLTTILPFVLCFDFISISQLKVRQWISILRFSRTFLLFHFRNWLNATSQLTNERHTHFDGNTLCFYRDVN